MDDSATQIAALQARVAELEAELAEVKGLLEAYEFWDSLAD